jgi:uroporphyrinogen III methyltransferase/synthase
MDDLERFHWLIFTSPNGVRYFFESLAASARDHRNLASAKFACIGPGTAKALAQAGFKADLVPEQYVAEGLLESLKKHLPNLRGHSILIPRAQEAREVLPETLREWGAEVVVAPAYKTVQPRLPEDFQRLLRPDTRLLFTSSSTVKHWLSLTGNKANPCYCIGPVTAATAEEHGLSVLGVAREHTIEGLVNCLLEMDRTLL